MTRIFIQIILSLSLVCNAFADLRKLPSDNNLDNVLEQNITKFLNTFAAKNKLNQSMTLSVDQKKIVSKNIGFSNLKTKRKLNSNDIFPLFDLSQNFTAAAILKLQDKGLLDVKDTVSEHLSPKIGIWPDNKLPSWANVVTIQNLLTHSSGIPNYIDKLEFTEKEKLSQSLKSIISFTSKQNTIFKPGSRVSISNSNYIILGLIIEAKTGKSLATFLENEFFKPLGMNNTKLVSKYVLLDIMNGEPGENYTKNYLAINNPNPNHVHSVKYIQPMSVKGSNQIIYADNGIISSANDLDIWNNALHSGKVLSKKSYKKMIRPYYKVDYFDTFDQTYIGYGIFISKMSNGLVYLNNHNYSAGYSLSFGYLPGYDMSLNILANISPSSIHDNTNKRTGDKLYQYRYVNLDDQIYELFDVVSKSMPGCKSKSCKKE